jgi:predicted RNA binding protein YcfA (HicA-like mRNA interferase family)
MSAHLPSLKPKQVLKALERAGFAVDHVTGSHYILKHPLRPALRVTLPYHRKDLKRGTVQAIVKQAGLTVEKFSALL